jgi:hypothetical protein
MDNKGTNIGSTSVSKSARTHHSSDLVLDKSIFSSVFDKDIRRAYLYKKTERIGKALHMLLPAFRDSKALKDRAERVCIALIDASLLPPPEAKETIARELLTLSSIIAMARASGRLSPMNAEIILREAEHLLLEVASYEEPNIMLGDAPTLAALSRTALRTKSYTYKRTSEETSRPVSNVLERQTSGKGHTKKMSVTTNKNERRENILTLLKDRGSVYIKDLSTMIKDVSEKTIQRELQSLVLEGIVTREGERRWTRYTLA